MKKALIIGVAILLILVLLPYALSPKKELNPLYQFFPTPTPIHINTPQKTLPKLQLLRAIPDDGTKDVPVNTAITITFNRPFSEKEVYFSLAPHTDYTLSINGTTLIATPTSALQTATFYSYLVYPVSDDTQAKTRSFSTPGATSQTPLETRPYRLSEDHDAYLRQNSPDVFLANNTPYATNTFSVDNSFNSSKSHFYFTVAIIGSTGKQDFLNWLHALDLTDEEIAKLDIRYQ